jgi:hypothetical protein
MAMLTWSREAMRFRKSPQILAMASLSSPQFAAKAISAIGAFSSEVETGSRQENASKTRI